MKMLKRILALLAFLLALLLAVWLLTDTLLIKRDDGIVPMKAYYKQPENTIDVLFLGSSHAGMNFSSQILWDEYGISSYMLWSSLQPFWTSYYWLIEALKTQTPKVVVLEMYTASQTNFDYLDEARQVTNLEGMRPSLNKWRAIQVSAPRERWLDLFMELPVAHARYGELEEKDFQYYPWSDLSTNKGSLAARSLTLRKGTIEKADDVAAVREVRPLYEKVELYLNKIIDLCREKSIPLLLVVTPTVTPVAEQPYYNRVAQIAEENGLPYLNLNLLDDETGYDRATDMGYDAHVNVRGLGKVTRYVAKYLKANYELPDHRGEAAYISWEKSSHKMRNQYVSAVTGLQDYLDALEKEQYLLFAVKFGSWKEPEVDPTLLEPFEQIGLGLEATMGPGGAWLLDRTGEQSVLEYIGDDSATVDCTAQGAELHVDFSNRAILLNGAGLLMMPSDGFALIVYDPYEQRCIDCTYYVVQEDFAFHRN